MARRRFIADTWTATAATLSGDQAVHLARVLRAAPGQVYDIVVGGFLHRAEITSITPPSSNSPEQVHFLLHEELESNTALPLHLLLAVFKFDHFEWAIEKATELGVARITPILARRTEKHLALAAPKRAERWRRIALESSKQSRRTSIPEIANPIQLKQALAAEQSPIRILLSELEQSTPLLAALQQADLNSTGTPSTGTPPTAVSTSTPATGLVSTEAHPSHAVLPPEAYLSHTVLPTGARLSHTDISAETHPSHAVISTAAKRSGETPVSPTHARTPDAKGLPPLPGLSQPHSDAAGRSDRLTHALAIGPEGGWTPEELQLFTDHNWIAVTLGPRILRAETAAIAAIAIAGAHLG